jgi:hypothetical protein
LEIHAEIQAIGDTSRDTLLFNSRSFRITWSIGDTSRDTGNNKRGKMTAILYDHGQFLHICASSITSNPNMENHINV